MNLKVAVAKKRKKNMRQGTEGVFLSAVGAGLRIGDKRWTGLEEATAWQGRKAAETVVGGTGNRDTTHTQKQGNKERQSDRTYRQLAVILWRPGTRLIIQHREKKK